MTDHQDIELRSEEVKEILGMPPSWIIRWGTSAIVLIVIALITITYFIQYPDKIQGDLSLNTQGKPDFVYMKIDGYIGDIFVSDSAYIEADFSLAVIKNELNYISYTDLKDILRLLSATARDSINNVFPDYDLNAGNFEKEYSQLKRNLEAYQESVQTTNSREVVGNLKTTIRKINRDIKNKKKHQENLYSILDENDRKKSILRSQLENKTGTNVGEKMRKIEEDNNRLTNEIQEYTIDIKTLEDERRDLYYQINNEGNSIKSGDNFLWQAFQDDLRDLNSKIREWEKNHLLKSPISGQVSYYNFSTTTYYKKGDPLLAIFPKKDTIVQEKLHAEVKVKVEGYGKVKLGQQVLVKFDSYPFREYGVVKGEVVQKSSLQNNKEYLLEVSLPKNLVSSFGLPLKPEAQMIGKAEILTEEKRLIERFFEQFRSIFK